MNKKEAKEFLQEFTPRMFWESLSSMLMCNDYKLIKINIIAERKSHDSQKKKVAPHKKKKNYINTHNEIDTALALCRRAVAHAQEIGDIPRGHPIIIEMMDLLAQQQ